MGRYRAETEQETARRFLMQADHAARLASAAEVLLNVPAVELTVTRIQDETIIEVAATSLSANPRASTWSTLTPEQIIDDVVRMHNSMLADLTTISGDFAPELVEAAWNSAKCHN